MVLRNNIALSKSSFRLAHKSDFFIFGAENSFSTLTCIVGIATKTSETSLMTFGYFSVASFIKSFEIWSTFFVFKDDRITSNLNIPN